MSEYFYRLSRQMDLETLEIHDNEETGQWIRNHRRSFLWIKITSQIKCVKDTNIFSIILPEFG